MLESSRNLGNILGNWPKVVAANRKLPRNGSYRHPHGIGNKAAIKAAGAVGKAKRVGDGGGLYFEARPTGGGWWRFRYFFAGREGMLSLGTYPEVSLTAARKRRHEAREAVASGIDPSVQRKADKAVKRV